MVVIHRLNNLEVTVDAQPIGGYRGKVGTLNVGHKDKLVFTDWSENDLRNLAELTRLVLKIQETAHVNNTLIFGKKDGVGDFKLSFVPYPRCNWIEKMQGIIHVIFGTSALKVEQTTEITQFYQAQFSPDKLPAFPVQEGEKAEGKIEARKIDAFCRPEVIEKQKITDIPTGNGNIHLLHDNRPKGATSTDPHLLIIPEGNSGHCDGSGVPVEKRFQMLKIVQKAMEIFQKLGFRTFLYLERNGENLQGVKHKHSHVQGIQQFPRTFFAKILVLLRLLYTPALSSKALTAAITRYQNQQWN